ncbi:hypothetical protein GCM10025884_14580 [Leuconostoc gelidum subsp. gelidum]|nr:hypothetical protein GCM10025884_14580 [Leuconostoc gelidum subsp. gelidum]
MNAFNKIKRNDRETTNNTQNIDVMTQNELQVLVMQISKKYFGLPFKHIARFNTRLKTTGVAIYWPVMIWNLILKWLIYQNLKVSLNMN